MERRNSMMMGRELVLMLVEDQIKPKVRGWATRG